MRPEDQVNLERKSNSMTDQVEESAASATSSPDFVLSTLQSSVKAVIDLNNNRDRAVPISKALLDFVDSLIPSKTPPEPDDDKCKNPDPVTKPLCSALKLAEATANSTFGTAENAAAGNLYAAVNGWTLAVSTYESAVEDAMATLETAVEAAKATYSAALKAKPDSPSRALYLWYTMKAAAIGAVQTYESAVAGAAATLASSAGTTLTGYQGYAAAIYAAEAARVTALSAAGQTFWLGVEQGRDS
jgi:hypothetical protein